MEALASALIVACIRSSPSCTEPAGSVGVGALLGSALCPWIRRRWGSARAVLGGNLIGALLFLLMPAGSGHLGWVLFAVGNAGFAAGTVVTSICTRTHRQTAAPSEMLSRVMATVRFVSWGAVPFGALLAGLVASSWGLRPALWLAGVLAFVPYVILALSPVGRLRDLEDGSAVIRRSGWTKVSR